MSEKSNALSALLEAFNQGTDLDAMDKKAADAADAEKKDEAAATDKKDAAEKKDEAAATDKKDDCDTEEKTASDADILPALRKLAGQAIEKDIATVQGAAEEFGRTFAKAAMEEIRTSSMLEQAFAAGYDAMSKVAAEIEFSNVLNKVAEEAYEVTAKAIVRREAYEKIASVVTEQATPTTEEILAVHGAIVKEAYDVMAAACRKKGLIGGE